MASNTRALVTMSQELIERGHAIVRSKELKDRSRRNLPRTLEQVVWMRDLIGEQDAAREVVLAFVDLAMRNAQDDAGDTQNGGALEQAVMRWSKAACSR